MFCAYYMVGVDTKNALLDCAEEALRSHGYDGFSYADLASEVGIRKASIHHHFPKKADLALALINRYAANFFQALDDIVVESRTGSEQLKAYVALYRNALDDGNKLCLCVAFCVGRDGLSAPVLEQLDAFHVTVVRWLSGAFAAGKSDGTIAQAAEADAEAYACLAQMEGAQLMARAAKDMARFNSAVSGLLCRLA